MKNYDNPLTFAKKFTILLIHMTKTIFPSYYKKLKIYYLYKSGVTYVEIGSLFGISKQRVYQIIKDMEKYKNILDKYTLKDIKYDKKLRTIVKEIKNYGNKRNL